MKMRFDFVRFLAFITGKIEERKKQELAQDFQRPGFCFVLFFSLFLFKVCGTGK